jgi:tubulin epsilon
MFTDVMQRDHQLVKADPRHSVYLACALMVRGQVELSDVRRNIDRCVLCCKLKLKARLKKNMNFIHWNQEGWKTGICSVAPVNQV